MTRDVLDLPLPAGMRDLLPDEAASRGAVSSAMLESFELFGYRVVRLPVFEFAGVVERGLGEAELGEVLRFVEPESGEVAVLRPDMTPQIARIIATRLRDQPPPYRLAYEGSVVRRRAGRAKKHRQIPQVGLELAGDASGEAELELLTCASRALRATGLERVTFDLSDAGIIHALVSGAPPALVALVTSALARKDEAELRDLAVQLTHGDVLVALTRIHGGDDAVRETVSCLAHTPAKECAARLSALYRRVVDSGIASSVSVDPAEVRGFSYYTGATFAIYAEGPGFSLGGGGRYDDLLARFGVPMSAAGLAVDLDALDRALAHAHVTREGRVRVVACGANASAEVDALRGDGIAAVACAPEGASAYARAWSYGYVLDTHALTDVASGAAHARAAGEDAVACVRRVLKG